MLISKAELKAIHTEIKDIRQVINAILTALNLQLNYSAFRNPYVITKNKEK